MWTLGCVYLEFVTWMIGGWSLVKEFTNVRRAADYQLLYATLGIKTATFFELQIDGYGVGQGGMRARVKPQVTQVNTSCISQVSTQQPATLSHTVPYLVLTKFPSSLNDFTVNRDAQRSCTNFLISFKIACSLSERMAMASSETIAVKFTES